MSYNPPPQPPQGQPQGQPQQWQGPPPQGQPQQWQGQPPQGQPPQQWQGQPQGQPPNMPPPPPGYGYGGKPHVPAQVNTAAILLFIAGGFGILGGLLFLAIGSLGALFVLVGVILLIIGGLEIWVGVALRQLKQWARVAAITLAGISAVFSLLSLFKGGYTSIVGLAIDIVIIYMLTQKPVVEAFNQAGR